MRSTIIDFMPLEKIHIYEQHTFWMASREHIPSLIMDPDEEDHRPPRYSDKYQLDWLEIGAYAEKIGNIIQSTNLPRNHHAPGYCYLEIETNRLPLPLSR